MVYTIFLEGYTPQVRKEGCTPQRPQTTKTNKSDLFPFWAHPLRGPTCCGSLLGTPPPPSTELFIAVGSSEVRDNGVHNAWGIWFTKQPLSMDKITDIQ